MQYIRRRIQRVSGVTIRDERIESRDFSVPSARESWDGSVDEATRRTPARHDARSFDQVGIFRQRT